MADPDRDVDVLKLLTEDIQAHREYIQNLYRNAAVVGGAGLLLAVTVGTWFLGRQLDASILQHGIDKALIQKMDGLVDQRASRLINEINDKTEAATSSAIASIGLAAERAGNTAREEITSSSESTLSQAKTEVDQYLRGQLTEEVRGSLKPLLDELSESNIVDISQQLTIPAGFVAAFDRPAGCPTGWVDLGSELRGRTIVGAVRGSNDTYGFRRTGGSETHTLTKDEMPNHQHSMGVFIRGEGGGSGYSYTRPANGHGDPTSAAGGGQPHNNMPPYIALYICKKA